MPEFEPPKYIASAIAAINEGAKAAQTTATALLTLGAYLLMAAVTTTDRELLLNTPKLVPLLGIALAPPVVFAILPAAFVVLYVFMLYRYDLLAINLRSFYVELKKTVPREADRERCRQLLSNMEFVIAAVVPRKSPLYSHAAGLVDRIVAVYFPLFLLILVQASSLRYQSGEINLLQQLAILMVVVAILWFFRRRGLARRETPEETDRHWSWPWPTLLLVVAVELIFVIPPPLVPARQRVEPAEVSRASSLAANPLDLLFCPSFKFGCRYLRVDHSIIIGRVLKPDALIDLRGKGSARIAALPLIEGASLQERRLRFADFTESALYGANLIAADLRGANLTFATLLGADLTYANLGAADMNGADLTNARLRSTFLGATFLAGANLSGADLTLAELQEADLTDADLRGANLTRANLTGAKVRHANLSGANLTGSTFEGAELSGSIYDRNTRFPSGLDPQSRDMHRQD